MERKRVERVVGSPVRTAMLLAALGTALLLADGASGRISTKVFTDPAGDGGLGPDIRAISIGDSGGVVRFKLDAPGLKIAPGRGVKATFLFVDLDTNKDGKRDYALIVGNDAKGFSFDVTGPSGKSVRLSTWLSYFRTGDSYWITVSSTDLGGATSFDLYARAGTIADDGSVARSDDSPDEGSWSYSLTSRRAPGTR